jgi:outer membrane receptor protein involved in Fe transport
MPRPLTSRGSNEQRHAELVLSGPGGRILGRDLQWILGADYRREAGSLALDPLHGRDTFLFGPDPPQGSGTYDARELFAEVQVPLLHDRRWVRDVALNFGLRWSDFSSFDQQTSWHAGLRWQPIEELTLRANYGEVFRVPSLAELYEQPEEFEEFLPEPCGNDPTPEQQANCAANGVPGGAYVQDDRVFVADYRGNPDLEPETGHTLGVGLIYAPVWARGLSASVDYFQANLSNHIAFATPDSIFFECAERGSSLCEAITRLPNGHVAQVTSTYTNSGELEVRAVDFAFHWSVMTRIGELNSSLLATYLDRWDRQLFPGGDVDSFAGNFGAGARPHWRASGHLDWRSGPWMAGYACEYIGSYSEYVEPWESFDIFFDPYYRRVDPVLYHDIEAGFRFDGGVSVRAAITNVTDEEPPYLNIAPANTDVATYRLLGRSYFLELRYQVE